jgi:hypothetical protein
MPVDPDRIGNADEIGSMSSPQCLLTSAETGSKVRIEWKEKVGIQILAYKKADHIYKTRIGAWADHFQSGR